MNGLLLRLLFLIFAWSIVSGSVRDHRPDSVSIPDVSQEYVQAIAERVGVIPAGPVLVAGDAIKAKRVGPPRVPPVTIGSMRFEVIHWGKERGLGQNGGYIAAFDTATGKESWTLKIFDVQYDPTLETDVQDVFIKSMAKTSSGQKLKIIDERGRTYLVDPTARSVQLQPD